jgi:hypothetical protein
MNPIRTWKADRFKLEIFDHPKQWFGVPQHRLAYKFYDRDVLIFEGDDYGCSPLNAIDSDECVSSLLSFLSLRPGDTDAEYFKDYTEAQLCFADHYGEELSMYVLDLEEKNQ